MAVANPTRETTETLAEVLQLLETLPPKSLALFLDQMNEALEKALREHQYRVVIDVLQAWQHFELARRDPNYRTNMARSDQPLGETFTLEEIKQRFGKRPDA